MCGVFFYKTLVIKGNDQKNIKESFDKIKHRGPDESVLKYYNKGTAIGFHRLAIIGKDGMQPFENDRFVVIVNGEIYNYKELISTYKFDYFKSDCEIILPIFTNIVKNKTVASSHLKKLARLLDGEFAIIIYEKTTNDVYYITDELRVRPLFIGYNNDTICLASEQKAIPSNLTIEVVPARMVGINKHCEEYYYFRETLAKITFDQACKKLNKLLTANVTKKLNPEREYGFLLSGGLDSSLICAIAAKFKKIRTFTIGFSKLAPDVIEARKVAKHIGSIHCEIICTYEDAIDIIPEVIYCTETWDETTIRASTPMLLALKYIKKHYPNIAVIYSGEVADELLRGYKYNYLAPNYVEAKKDMIKRLSDITLFDGLRADRIVSSMGCELRLPFFSKDLLKFVLSLPDEFLDPKINEYNPRGIEKNILRVSFENYLPNIWRKKDAFSDATSVNSEWKVYLKETAYKHVTESRFKSFEDEKITSVENMWYKDIFDSYNFTDCTPYKWLPSWSDQKDSSAYILTL